MPLHGSLVERLCERLSARAGTHIDVEREVPVGGGSINDSYRLDTNEGRYFVKVNWADRFPSMFEAETDGLQRLSDANAIRVPEVIAFGEEQDDSYLLLEHVDGGLKTAGFWEELGLGLARLHANSSDQFGLERDNYIGSLAQRNTQATRWDEFFIQQRLEPMVRMASEKQRIGKGDVLRFERLYMKLPSLFPAEQPALLHGDLWSGNVLCDQRSKPVLIDPAVYYGHREMDIAMTKLFGGIDPEFYSAYNRNRPMDSGWEERCDLWNLYPLLVHVNLFGGGYAQRVSEVLRRFA